MDSGWIKEAWSYGKIIWKVVVGTSYDPHIELMANRLEIKLYTVSELCAGYRERVSEANRGSDENNGPG